jgi:hypothetical protein
VTPCAIAARAIANDIVKFSAPSSTPGSKWQCRSITPQTPQKADFQGFLPTTMWRQDGVIECVAPKQQPK